MTDTELDTGRILPDTGVLPVIAAFEVGRTEIVVLRHNKGNKNHPYVVHSYNPQDGGFYYGDYCEDLKQGTRAFVNRVSRKAGI